MPQTAVAQNETGRFVWVVDGDGKAVPAPDPRRQLARRRLGGARRPQARRPRDRRQPRAPASRRAGQPRNGRSRCRKFFIHRPVFAGVIAIVIVLAGLLAAKLLAVAQYPEIAPPTVLITTSYPGASAETLVAHRRRADRGAALRRGEAVLLQLDLVLERQPADHRHLRARHQRRPAIFDVNNRVQRALPRLPDEVRRNGVIVQKRSFDILLVVVAGLARQPARYAVPLQLRLDQPRRRAEAPARRRRRARSSARATTRCASGSTRRRWRASGVTHLRRRRGAARAERAVRRRPHRHRTGAAAARTSSTP